MFNLTRSFVIYAFNYPSGEYRNLAMTCSLYLAVRHLKFAERKRLVEADLKISGGTGAVFT